MVQKEGKRKEKKTNREEPALQRLSSKPRKYRRKHVQQRLATPASARLATSIPPRFLSSPRPPPPPPPPFPSLPHPPT